MTLLHKVFVYGTLRKHEKNHSLLSSGKCIAEQAWAFGELFDTGYGYPAMKQSSEGKVYGELYEIDSSSLIELDQLEDYTPGGEDNLYERIEQSIYTDKGTEKSFIYIANKNERLTNKIPYGDWKLYRLLNNKPEHVHYFAYGSCMDEDRFRQHKVDHYFKDITGVGTLFGYSMKYLFLASDGGRADIIEDGGKIEGIVYKLPFEGIKYLFEREGFYSGGYRATFVDVSVQDQLLSNVLTFHVYDKKEETAPPLHYATEIMRGSKGRVSSEYFQQLDQQLNTLGVKVILK